MSMQRDRLVYRDAIAGLTKSLNGPRRKRPSTEPADPEARAEPTPRTERPTAGSPSRETEVERRVQELKDAHSRYVAGEGEDGEPDDPVDRRVQELEEARRATVRRGTRGTSARLSSRPGRSIPATRRRRNGRSPGRASLARLGSTEQLGAGNGSGSARAGSWRRIFRRDGARR